MPAPAGRWRRSDRQAFATIPAPSRVSFRGNLTRNGGAFTWAYERSAARYAAVRQSLGEPDPFRMRYRDRLRDLISEIIRERLGRKETTARIVSWVDRNIDVTDRARFREMTENEILGLHEGNFARYRVKPSEFEAWQRTWSRPTSGA